MKKEIERIYNENKDKIKLNEIVVQIEKSDPYDNRSPRCYRIYTILKNDEIICEYGFCKNKQTLLERFERKLREMK